MKTTTSNDLSELYEILKNIHQQIATQNKEIAEIKKELDHHIRKTNKESEVIGAHVTETTQVNPFWGEQFTAPIVHTLTSFIVLHGQQSNAKTKSAKT